VEARQYLSTKRRLPSFATPINAANPYRLGALAGWTARGECVHLQHVGQGTLDALGRCAIDVFQSGTYLFRVCVPGYEVAESDVVCVHGPQTTAQRPAMPTVPVFLRPKWAKCLVILTRTSDLAAPDLDMLKGRSVILYVHNNHMSQRM
jgi:hypothetical protein